MAVVDAEAYRQKMIAKFGGEEGYKKWRSEISSKGGSRKVVKGFAARPDVASRAGAIGGRISRRKKKDAV